MPSTPQCSRRLPGEASSLLDSFSIPSPCEGWKAGRGLVGSGKGEEDRRQSGATAVRRGGGVAGKIQESLPWARTETFLAQNCHSGSAHLRFCSFMETLGLVPPVSVVAGWRLSARHSLPS